MPVFVEDPSQFSKSKLKSDLVAHNVALPSEESNKQVYVELHLKHIDHKSAADFSSDEEDLLATDDVTEETKHSGDSEMLDPSGLTDDELRAALLKCGVNIGPITATTRALYERRLIKVLQADVQEPSLNGTADAALYSDSEEEEVEDRQNGEEAENGEEANAQEEDSIAEQAVQEPDSSLNQSENPAESRSQNTGFVFHGCFSHSSRLRFSIPPEHREGSAKRNAGNVVESSSQRIQTPLSQIASGFSRASVNRPSAIEPGKESSYHSPPSPSPVLYRATPHGVRGCNQRNVQLPEEPMTVDEPVTELSADTATDSYSSPPGIMYATDSYSSPPGIIVTRRKPIKGAAGRPVVYKYPVTPTLTPVSPTTAERRELERRLVPIWVRMLVFVVVACLLILIYTYVNYDNNPLVSLLDSLSQGSEEEQLLTSSEDMSVTNPISGQE